MAIKTFDQIKLVEADEDTLIEIREEAQMMAKVGTYRHHREKERSKETEREERFMLPHNQGNHPNIIGFVGAVTNPSAAGHELQFR